MPTLTFAEDNPQAATLFAILYQGVATANPGRRGLGQLTLERHLIEQLDAISTPGQMLATGFTPRALREPCVLALTPQERDLAVAYLSIATFQPFLSGALLDLLEALADPPTQTAAIGRATGTSTAAGMTEGSE